MSNLLAAVGGLSAMGLAKVSSPLNLLALEREALLQWLFALATIALGPLRGPEPGSDAH